MSCEHKCPKPPLFPRLIYNRPGLNRIDYRIGGYTEMRTHILDEINKASALQSWTHREVDDPGIALVESAAMVGDILTFYQRLYANESYLRTANWRESISDLVRLLGYRLSPGVAGETTFALEAKGDRPVIVPAGFGLKAQLEGIDDPVEFETSADITAYPHLSAFNVYRPRQSPAISPGVNEFVIDTGDGSGIVADDRLLVGSASPNATDPKRINDAEILVVDEVSEAFGEYRVKVKGAITKTKASSPIIAYKLGRSFRHFGHTAPPVTVDTSGETAVTRSTTYKRPLDEKTDIDVVDPSLEEAEFLMDQEIDDLAPGSHILIQATLRKNTSVKPKGGKQAQSTQSEFERTLVRTIQGVSQGSYTWGPASGACTKIELNIALPSQVQSLHGMTQVSSVDIRSMVFHEVIDKPVYLKAAYQPTALTSGKELYFYGTGSAHQALNDRRMLLVGPDEQTQSVQVMSLDSTTVATASQKLMRRFDLDQDVTYSDYDFDSSTVTVYGNLVDVTQGRTEKQVVLGSGDQRRSFQTFALPKTPLTYLLNETRTPAETPELTIYVDGILWTQLDTLFAAGPDEHVYAVREDHEANSFIQFGNDITGARLPSGKNNVVAIFRTGNGANGELKADTTPQATGKLKELSKAFLYQRVIGGAQPESEDNARNAAPGKMQSLGRLVGLQDYEAEVLALPGVLKARAAWTAPDGVPMLSMVVLTEGGTEDDTTRVEATMRTYNRCRGAARFPIDVLHGTRQYVYLGIHVGFDAAYREADVNAAIQRALGAETSSGDAVETGLFSLAQRQFGESVHRSHIVAAVQQVDGVVWVKLKSAFLMTGFGYRVTDPALLTVPVSKTLQSQLRANATSILALYSTHLVLNLSKQEITGECSA